MADEATLRIILQEEGGLNPESRPAPSRLLDPSTPNQPSVQMASRNQPVTYTSAPPTAQTPQFTTDLKDALISVGYAKKEANSLVDKLMRSGQTFATVIDALVAIANKNFKPLLNAPPPVVPGTQPQTPEQSATIVPVGETKQPEVVESKPLQIEVAAPLPVAQVPESAPQSKVEQQPKESNANVIPETFDPVAEAQKRIEAEKRRQQVQDAYQQLNPQAPEVPFDPTKEAEKRREAEARKVQIDKAYENMYGTAKRTESVFDEAFSLAKTLRGSIGGAFGTIFGAALDIWAIFDERNKQERDAAAQLELMTFPVSKPAQPSPVAPVEVQPPAPPTPSIPQLPDVSQDVGGQEVTQQEPSMPSAKKTQLVPSSVNVAPKTQLTPSTQPTAPVPQPKATPTPTPQPTTAKPPVATPPAKPPIPPVNAGAGASAAGAGAAGAAGAGAAASAGAGGAGAATGSAIAAAAGPVAIIMAVKEISDALIAGTRTFVNNVQSLASNFVSADASVSTSIETVGKATESVSNKFGILGAAVNQSITSFGAFMRTLDGVADRYANLSPDIAVAQAMSDVRQILGDFQRAQRIGPQLARYIQQQSEVQQRFEDIKIKLLMAIMPAVTKILELIELGLPVIDTGVTAVTSFTTATVSPILELVTIIRQIQRLLSGQTDAPMIDDPTTTILRLFGPNSMQIPNNMATV